MYQIRRRENLDPQIGNALDTVSTWRNYVISEAWYHDLFVHYDLSSRVTAVGRNALLINRDVSNLEIMIDYWPMGCATSVASYLFMCVKNGISPLHARKNIIKPTTMTLPSAVPGTYFVRRLAVGNSMIHSQMDVTTFGD